MTSQDIIDSINNYLAIITDDKALQELFAQGNCFYYDYTQAATTTATGHVHAYPGIYNGTLYFFMIPAEHDNATGAQDLAAYTQCCPIITPKDGGGVGTHRIPDNVALERITLWEEYSQTWIPLQVASEYGMFQAFGISKEDFETEDDLVYLALKENLATSVGFDADLIVANVDKTAAAMVYDDFVKPVPPYPTPAIQEKFYLLTI